MLVWEESHTSGLNEDQMRNLRFMPQQELCMREMIARHMNHPSITIWGCLKECADSTPCGAECFRRVFRLLHELDTPRSVTAALVERMGCLAGNDSDVVSINSYLQWHHDALALKLSETGGAKGQGKPVIVREIGAGTIPGYHALFFLFIWFSRSAGMSHGLHSGFVLADIKQ